jgi:hypothetical protein
MYSTPHHNEGGNDNLNGIFNDSLSKPQSGAIIVNIRYARFLSRPINGVAEASSLLILQRERDPAIYHLRHSAYTDLKAGA